MPSDLRFEVLPSPGSNDHQARILVDGVDWLGETVLGLDPPDLKARLQSGAERMRGGRCECGCVGCDDFYIEVRRRDGRVEWTAAGRGTVIFEEATYSVEVARFISDHAWEDVGRTVERRVNEIFAGATVEGDRFDWASTRIRPSMVHLSFSGAEGQRLLDFSWDGASLESALTRARAFRRERCDQDFGVDGDPAV